ncbi:MAG: hypothetical protein ACK562_16685 [Acidobacteriota bacterium]
MRWRQPEDLRTIEQLLDFYRQADEAILGKLTDLDRTAISRLSAESRQLAAAYAGLAPRQLAARCGWPVIEESLTVAAGRLHLLGECSFAPGRQPRLLINRRAIDAVSHHALKLVGDADSAWFSPAALDDLTIAHELHHLLTGHLLTGHLLTGHLLTGQAATTLNEQGAHIFARALTGWPFSPLVLPALLQRRSWPSRRRSGI